MLAVAIAARNFGCRPSALLGKGDSVSALDFDLAASLRLIFYDNEQERDKARLVSAACAAGFAGETLKFDGETDDDFVTI